MFLFHLGNTLVENFTTPKVRVFPQKGKISPVCGMWKKTLSLGVFSCIVILKAVFGLKELSFEAETGQPIMRHWLRHTAYAV